MNTTKTQLQTLLFEKPLWLQKISFPQGLIGLPDLKSMELLQLEEEVPFFRLRETDPQGLEFFILRAKDLGVHYAPEFLKEDLEALELDSIKAFSVFCIAIVQQVPSSQVFVNLVAPILIHKNLARQVILKNYANYSTKFLLTASH